VHSINRCGGSKRLAAMLGLRFTETRGRKAQAARLADTAAHDGAADRRRLHHAGEQFADFVWV
jgi:hypothetical protein